MDVQQLGQRVFASVLGIAVLGFMGFKYPPMASGCRCLGETVICHGLVLAEDLLLHCPETTTQIELYRTTICLVPQAYSNFPDLAGVKVTLPIQGQCTCLIRNLPCRISLTGCGGDDSLHIGECPTPNDDTSIDVDGVVIGLSAGLGCLSIGILVICCGKRCFLAVRTRCRKRGEVADSLLPNEEGNEMGVILPDLDAANMALGDGGIDWVRRYQGLEPLQ